MSDKRVKVLLCDWRRNQETCAAFEKLRYKEETHEITEGAMFYIAGEFLKEGLNVMIKHHDDGFLLAVDSHRFQQM